MILRFILTVLFIKFILVNAVSTTEDDRNLKNENSSRINISSDEMIQRRIKISSDENTSSSAKNDTKLVSSTEEYTSSNSENSSNRTTEEMDNAEDASSTIPQGKKIHYVCYISPLPSFKLNISIICEALHACVSLPSSFIITCLIYSLPLQLVPTTTHSSNLHQNFVSHQIIHANAFATTLTKMAVPLPV